MTLLWFDGFEGYANDTDMISAMDSSSIFSLITTASLTHGNYGRRSSRGLRLPTQDNYLKAVLNDNYVSAAFGFSIYNDTPTVPSYNTTFPFFELLDGTTRQLAFFLVGSEIHVYNGAGAKLGETSGFGFSVQTERFFEVKVTIDNSAGVVTIKSSGSEVLSLTSQDTQQSVNAYFNVYSLRGGNSGCALRVDDFYFCDLTGTKNNDFLGDIRVDVLRPNGAGTYTDFTPSAGSNYQNVDETYPDDDTTYNDGASVGNQDSYALGDLSSPTGTTIHGVKSQITVRKTDAGTMQAKLLTRAGTTDDLGDAITLSDSFTTHIKIFEDNPDDSADWEDADINGMEVGVEVTA